MITENQVSPDAETLNPAAEDITNETPEVVTPEVDAKPEPTESEESKALKRMQRRIDKRTADVYRERAQNETLAQRIAQLEQRLQPADSQTPPNSDDLERVVLTKAQSIAQEIAQQQQITRNVQSVLSAGKDLPAFDAACNAVNEELPFYDRSNRPTPFLAAVLEFDRPAQLLHYLGTNPDLAAELADLNPTRLVRRLDAIEREMSDKGKPKTSAAPKPLEPVKAQGSSKEPSEMSDKEFAAWRRRQISQRR
jgi:hypothetical protein